MNLKGWEEFTLRYDDKGSGRRRREATSGLLVNAFFDNPLLCALSPAAAAAPKHRSMVDDGPVAL